MKQNYMLKIRLNEFISQLIHYYSHKTNRTMQDISTDALHEYLKNKLSSDEYQELLDFSNRRRKNLDKIDKEVNEDWFQYYDSLSEERKKLLDEVYNKCKKSYAKNNNIFFDDVKEFQNLKENEQYRIRLQISSENLPDKDKKRLNDLEEVSKMWKEVYQTREKIKKENKEVKNKYGK